ncbi:MAG: efflux RND transporter periplasmic adaptor subunit [Saprospiraceae bacterium]|nr:efflux RND transporter periplasmic adaptor subunit [Saprospiraceae bacterium]
MKQSLLTLVILTILLGSCSQPSQDTAIPEDVAGQRTLLDAKRQELNALKKEIADLEDRLGNQAGANSEEEAKVVTTSLLEPTTFRRFTEIQGNVEPVQENNISSETGGRIIRLLVKEGDSVNNGQLLASVDMEPLKKQIEELETSLQLATDVYGRQKRLWDQKIGSEIQYLQAKNNKERLEKGLDGLRAQMKKANIYAPISGVIEGLQVEQGDVAPPGMPIMQLINTRDLKIIAEVPERYVGTVHNGDKVKVQVPTLQTEQTETIRVIGRVVHPSNRTFHIETSLNNRAGTFKPNLLALVHIEDYKEENALVVSVDLVQQEVGGKQFVYIAENTDKGKIARKVYVKTGESYDNHIVILEGLKAGDEIVQIGARGLSENDVLEVKTETNG